MSNPYIASHFDDYLIAYRRSDHFDLATLFARLRACTGMGRPEIYPTGYYTLFVSEMGYCYGHRMVEVPLFRHILKDTMLEDSPGGKELLDHFALPLDLSAYRTPAPQETQSLQGPPIL